MGQAIGNLVVKECTPEALADDHLDIIFSGLDASVAGDIGMSSYKSKGRMRA